MPYRMAIATTLAAALTVPAYAQSGSADLIISGGPILTVEGSASHPEQVVAGLKAGAKKKGLKPGELLVGWGL